MFGKIIGWERDFFVLCFLVFIMSSLKNHFVVDFLVSSGSSCSLSFEFCRSLSNRDATNVATFLSLFESHSFKHGRKGREGLEPQSLVWSIIPFRNVGLFSSLEDYDTWQVLHDRVNTMDRLVKKLPSLVRRPRKI